MAQAARAGARRSSREGPRSPRRAVDRVAGARGPRRGPPYGALHDAPLPPWPGQSLDEKASSLDSECAWLLANDVLPADLVTRNREVAEAALRPWTPVFMHGDLQVAHVFVDGDEVTGVLDWSEAGQGDALYDLASLTLGHPEHLGDVIAGYGARRRPRRDPRPGGRCGA